MNEIIRTEPSQPAVEQRKVKEQPVVILPGEGVGDFLKIVAWLYLIASFFGGLKMIMHKSGASMYSAKSDPVLVSYGIGLMVSGVVFLALCQVLAAISYNVRVIANNSIKNKVE